MLIPTRGRRLFRPANFRRLRTVCENILTTFVLGIWRKTCLAEELGVGSDHPVFASSTTPHFDVASRSVETPKSGDHAYVATGRTLKKASV